jgi:hypothetical protein
MGPISTGTQGLREGGRRNTTTSHSSNPDMPEAFQSVETSAVLNAAAKLAARGYLSGEEVERLVRVGGDGGRAHPVETSSTG